MSPAASPKAESAKSAGGDQSLRVSTSPRPGSRLAVEVAVPEGRCRASYDAALDKLSRSIKLPGFRKGKVPRPVLLQQIGPLRIRATALEDLVDSCFQDAVRQEKIEAIGRPELERFEPGAELTFTLELDVEPTPTLRSTRGLVAEAVSVSFDPARVDEQLEDARKRLATLVPVEDRAAADGDVAEVSFRGTYVDNGEAIEGGSSDGMSVELEEGRMIPGFVEGILGMKPGDSRTVTCSFPESYPNEEAAGRQAEFAITLIELKTRELPALDDAFAQQASDKQTLAELRSELETRLKEDAERRHRANRQDALLEALVEQLEVELPETLVQDEIRALIEQTAGQIAQQGLDVRKLFTPDLIRSLRDTSRPEAEQRLRRNLALRALATAESITVVDDEIETKVRELRRGLSESANIDPQRLRAAVAEDLLRDKLLEWLEANSTIQEKVADGDGSEAAAAEKGGAKDSATTATASRSRSSKAAAAADEAATADAEPID
jgi:trigger factor